MVRWWGKRRGYLKSGRGWVFFSLSKARSWKSWIVFNRRGWGGCGGKPCIRGFRIRVADILELLAAGASEREILADYPFLVREDIQACLDYAAREVEVPTVRVS